MISLLEVHVETPDHHVCGELVTRSPRQHLNHLVGHFVCLLNLLMEVVLLLDKLLVPQLDSFLVSSIWVNK